MQRSYINAKKLFIIYDKVDINISNVDILNFLKKIIDIDNYLLGSTFNYKNNTNTFYIFIENIKNIRSNKKKFDIFIKNQLYIPTFQKTTNKKNIINIILKKNDILHNFDFQSNTLNGTIYLNSIDYLINLAKEKTPDEIQTILIENFTELYSRKGINFLNMLKKISEHYSKKKSLVQPQYSLQDFDPNKIPKEVFNWVQKKKKNSLVLFGPSGTGKTQLALALLKNQNPLTITNIEKLKDFDNNIHKALLFDDCNFDKLNREEIIHLVDNELDRDIRILYDSKTIPSGILKIFTSNKSNLFPYDNLKEIQRRITKVNIDKKCLT